MSAELHSGINISDMKRVFRVYLQLLFQICFVVGRIPQDIIINAIRLSRKVADIFVRF